MSNVFLRRLFTARNSSLKIPVSCCSFTNIASVERKLLNRGCSLVRNHVKLVERPTFLTSRCWSDMPKCPKIPSGCKDEEKPEIPKEKLSIFKKFKLMYKEYWYVLVPVHVATSIVWFGGFYYIAQSGVDIVGLLEHWNVSERIVDYLKDSTMGYFALAYACYKIATPARYTVTLGGTTLAINYLKNRGYIKPVPSKEKLIEMFDAKKENIMTQMRETHRSMPSMQCKIKDIKQNIRKKTDNIMEDSTTKNSKK